MAITISATNLGYFASSRFCPRCAWLRLNLKELPYQSFPGIFSTIDRYNKFIVQSYFNRENSLPLWLRNLGDVDRYIDPPHWSSFKVFDEASSVTLRGEADGIFQMTDGSYTIVDYKTSRYNGTHRGMFKSYEVQLNAYAYIGERLGLSPVSRLALVYMEPLTGEETAQQPRSVDEQGFIMGFEARIVDVNLKPGRLIPELLRKVKALVELEQAPQGKDDCKDCAAVAALFAPLGPAGGSDPCRFLAASRTVGGLGRRLGGIRGLDCGAGRVAWPAAGESHVALGWAARRGLTLLERASETQGRVRRLHLSSAPLIGVLLEACTGVLARSLREPLFSVLPVENTAVTHPGWRGLP